MTLPSNILPAEPSAAPCDLQANGGAPAQTADSATATLPFSSVLNQADAAPAGTPVANAPLNGALPNRGAVLYPANYYRQQGNSAENAVSTASGDLFAPAGTPGQTANPAGAPGDAPLAAVPSALPKLVPASGTAMYPANYYRQHGNSAEDAVSAASVDLFAPAGTPGQTADPGGAPGGAPLAAVPSALPKPAPTSVTILYPANYYRQQLGSADRPWADAPAGQPAPAETTLSGLPAASAEVKTEAANVVMPKGKSKSPVSPEMPVSTKSDDGSVMLAYQFVAGQWVPQPVAPPSVQLSAAAQPSSTSTQVAVPTSGRPMSANQALPTQADTPTAPTADNLLASFTVPKVSASENVSAPVASAVIPKPDAQSPAEKNDISPSPKSLKVNLSESTLPTTSLGKSEVAATPGVAAVAPAPRDLIPRFDQVRSALSPAPEKFAASNASGQGDSSSGVNPLSGPKEKKSLVIDDKKLTMSLANVGTSTADREIAMPYSVVNKSPSVDLSTSAGTRFQPNLSAETKNTVVLAAQAPRLVQEIHTIADRVSSIDRNSVEVRFDFSATDRLSVRVEYRDGTVHTTFKTDSSQLREVVATEWKSQNGSNEPRSYKMAEPVFSQSSSDRQEFSSAGDSSGRQRNLEQQPPQTASSFSYPGRNARSTTAAASQSARPLAPETSHHLHVLA